MFCRKKTPGGIDVLLSIKCFFFHVKQSSLNKIWCSYRRYVVIWNNSKNPTRCSTSGRGKILDLEALCLGLLEARMYI